MNTRTDDGFSLVEVVIAILLLAVISLALLPLTIRAAASSVNNQDTVSATAFANERLSVVQAGYPNDPASQAKCTDLASLLTSLNAAPAPKGLTARFTGIVCPASGYPRAETVTITVGGRGIASEVVVSTKVLVGKR